MRPGGPGVNQGPPPERATDHMPPVPDPAGANYRREPDLLTHRDDDYLQDAVAHEYGDEGGGLTPEELKLRKRRKAWRWVRRVMYVLIFLGVTGPIAAFYVIYQNVTVPDPQTVAFGQAQPVTVYYADGSVMTKLTNKARIFLKPDAIPINVRHAVEAAEDETFETNNGFDLKAIARTAMNQLTGGTGGGSTITQEYIKVTTGNSQHSLTRKVNEAIQAYKMTKTYTNKNDILAAYLNTVYFGNGAYGIETAALTYYGVKAADLTPEQASLLAGLIQLPGYAGDPTYQHHRFTYVWGRMLANHWITDTQYKAGAFPTPIPASQAGGSLAWDRSLIVQQVVSELANDGWDMTALKAHGAQIYTTIDPKAMTDAENSIAARLAPDAKLMNGQPMVINGKVITANGKPVVTLAQHQANPRLQVNPPVMATEAAALVSVNPANGEIVAYYGGNDSNQTQLDAANTPHQPGSSFKPYVLASGLEYMPDKIGLNSIYDPNTNQVIDGVHIANAEGDTCSNPCTVKEAMTNSLNVVFYQMGHQVGTDNVRSTAIQAGVASKDVNTGYPTLASLDQKTHKIVQVEGGIAIGQYEIRPIDQAQGYATFANNGMYIPVHFVKKVTDNTGVPLYEFNTPPKQAFSSDPNINAQIAHTVADSLNQVATSSNFALAKNRPADAKTGTQNYVAPDLTDLNYSSDAWTVGFTPNLVTAVWFGHYDKPGPLFGNNNNPLGGRTTNYNVFGREEPGQIWKTYMDAYLSNVPIQQFSTAPADMQGGWDFVHNVAASTENTPSSTPSQPTDPGGPPQQTSDQPTRPVIPTTTQTRNHPPPTSTTCSQFPPTCIGGGGVPTG